MVTSNFECVSPPAVGEITLLQPPILPILIEGSDAIGLSTDQPVEICQTETLSFENTGTVIQKLIKNSKKDSLADASASWQYTWDFGDGSVDTVRNTSHAFNTFKAGVHTVNLTVDAPKNLTGHSCLSTEDRYVQVKAIPKVDFVLKSATDSTELNINTSDPGAPFYEVCEGVRIDFEGAALTTIDDGRLTLDNFFWTFGNDSSSTASDTTTEYVSTSLIDNPPNDLYEVTLNVTTLEGCSDSESKQIKVYPEPKNGISFGDGSTEEMAICVDDIVAFDNLTVVNPGTIDSLRWDFGNGSFSGDFTPTQQYNEPGVFPVILTRTTDFGCMNTSNQLSVRVNDYPVAGFTATEVCDGEAVQFLPNILGDDVTYFWDFGVSPSVTSTEINPTHLFDVTWSGTETQREFDVELITTTNASSSAWFRHSDEYGDGS